MKLQALKEMVCEANRKLPELGLAYHTWGNASAFDKERGLVAIKPSGVRYEELTPKLVSVVELGGKHREGGKPSSDTPTHLALYRAFSGIGGIVHTHSLHATAWAQAGMPLKCFGTTHADHFFGEIPVTEEMGLEEVADAYEENTGSMIIEALRDRSPLDMPATLVRGHGAFTWGKDIWEALENASVLELVACMAIETLIINPQASPISEHLLRKHFSRKHGPSAYYGQ